MTTSNQNRQEMKHHFEYPILKEKKRYWIAVFPIIFTFTIFSCFFIHGTLQAYWTILILISLSSGISVYLLYLCITHLFALKYKSSPRKNSIPNFLVKTTKKKIMLFSFSIGFFIFWLMFLFFLQPSADGTHETLQLSDIIGGIIMNTVFSLVIYILLIHLFTWFTGINLVQNKKPHNHLTALEDFQENTLNSHNYKNNNTWKSWDHDPMNPASPEYQSTYKHWNHGD